MASRRRPTTEPPDRNPRGIGREAVVIELRLHGARRLRSRRLSRVRFHRFGLILHRHSKAAPASSRTAPPSGSCASRRHPIRRSRTPSSHTRRQRANPGRTVAPEGRKQLFVAPSASVEEKARTLQRLRGPSLPPKSVETADTAFEVRLRLCRSLLGSARKQGRFASCDGPSPHSATMAVFPFTPPVKETHGDEREGSERLTG